MPLQKKREQHFLTDLDLSLVHRELRPLYRIDTRRASGPGGRGQRWDFGLSTGADNLFQAIIVRLLTPRGELEHLGHHDYGSRVHELIGRENTETNRNLLKLFILEALKREPRIEKVTELLITTVRAQPSTVDVTLTVQPVDFSETVTLGVFSIDFGG